MVWKLYGLLLGMLVTVKITYNKKSLFNFNTLMVLIVLIY